MKRLIRRWILVAGVFRVVRKKSVEDRKIGSLRRNTGPTSISCGGLQSDRAMRVDAYGALLRSTASICAASLRPDIRSERSLEREFDLALPAARLGRVNWSRGQT
jgi:hypothetical protein